MSPISCSNLMGFQKKRELIVKQGLKKKKLKKDLEK